MTTRTTARTFTFTAALFAATLSVAAPVTYRIDPQHTFPSFEADHMGGLSTWRGKFNSTSGTIVLDQQAQTGSLDVQVDTASIDFGNDKLNEHARSADIFNVEKYPAAIYTGKLTGFKNGAPTEVDGTLQLHGVTRPVKLHVNRFLCKPNPMTKKETCGADASATLNREEFGIDYGKGYGFRQDVTLQIQVEAIRAD